MSRQSTSLLCNYLSDNFFNNSRRSLSELANDWNTCLSIFNDKWSAVPKKTKTKVNISNLFTGPILRRKYKMKHSERKCQIADNIIIELDRREFIAFCSLLANLVLIFIQATTDIVRTDIAIFINSSTFIVSLICYIQVEKILAKERIRPVVEVFPGKEAA